MTYLENNNSITRLTLLGTSVTDEGVRSLATMKQLRRLSLSGTRITDEALETIGTLRKLQILSVSDCQLTDAGMRQIAKLPELKSLYLNHTPISIEGIKNLKPLKLIDLDLGSNEAFNDECLATIVSQWPQLEDLLLGDTRVTGDGLKFLPKLKHLTVLSISTLRLTDKDMEPVIKTRSLESIDLVANFITDRTLDRLATMPHLGYVDIEQCPNVTRAGVKVLEDRQIKVQAMELQGSDAAEAMGGFLED
jgi:internalin A